MTDLASEYRTIHSSQPSYGSAGKRFSAFILPLLKHVGADSVIDYGCGKGAVGTAIATLSDADVYFYDPYVPQFAKRPERKFDLLVNTDVLEHVPEADLPDILRDMASLSDHCFIVISTRYADQLLSDGSNAHCTVHPTEWWTDLLSQHFNQIHAIDVGVQDTCAFITWQIPPSVEAELRRALRKDSWSRKLKRRRALIASWFKQRCGFFATLSDLHHDVAGKSVAVVGNARSLIGTDLGSEIDAHDLVIRFNRAPIAHTRSHGNRTDWLATGMPLSSDIKKQRGIKRMLWLSSNHKKITKNLLRDASTYIIPRSFYRELSASLGKSPSSGFTVIDILSKSGCTKVDLYGFDFFESKSLSCHLSMTETTHDFPSEKRLVGELCARDSRFKLR